MTKFRKVGLCAAVLAATFALVASGEAETATKAGETPAEGGADAPAQSVFAVGDAVDLGDYQLKVHGVSDLQSTNEYIVPEEGMRWVAVDTEVTNNGDAPAPISTLVQFEVQDATNASYDIAMTGETLPSLDGEAPPGGSRRGTMVFQVPAAATGLRLNFVGDLFGAGSATVQLTP